MLPPHSSRSCVDSQPPLVHGPWQCALAAASAAFTLSMDVVPLPRRIGSLFRLGTLQRIHACCLGGLVTLPIDSRSGIGPVRGVSVATATAAAVVVPAATTLTLLLLVLLLVTVIMRGHIRSRQPIIHLRRTQHTQHPGPCHPWVLFCPRPGGFDWRREWRVAREQAVGHATDQYIDIDLDWP